MLPVEDSRGLSGARRRRGEDGMAGGDEERGDERGTASAVAATLSFSGRLCRLTGSHLLSSGTSISSTTARGLVETLENGRGDSVDVSTVSRTQGGY